MLTQLEVTVWRGSIPESRHRIRAAAISATGEVHLETAGGDDITTLRSAAKPFQLLPLVERGHADLWGFSPEELAVMCASHTGSPHHVELVRGILTRLELRETDLACGYHDPLDAASLALLRAHPEQRSPVYNNCSGKHAGMLCLALSEKWETRGYERAEHPVQLLMRRTVAEVCGVTAESMQLAVDGCSVPVFALPLSAIARGYARFAAARDGEHERSRALDRIRRAMIAFPAATGGVGRFSTQLMECATPNLVAKGGAEGLESAGVVDRGIGVAVKCEDGASRAGGPAMVAVLDSLRALPGSSPTLESLRRPLLHNAAGLEVGRIEVEFKVAAPAGP
jgi:L-asparaginase II